MPTLNARILKCTVVLDAIEVNAIAADVGSPRVPLHIVVDGRTVTADITAKSVRKVQAVIREHGPEAVAVLLQGKLGKGDVLLEAGLAGQVKAKPAAEPAQAA
jgi:hypothetical protein